MPSGIDNFFKNNLITICFDHNFQNFNCLFGIFEIILSVIFIIITIKGLLKLLNYYDTINYETILLLVSIIQIILLDIIIIIPHDLLFEFFFFLQICLISLIIRNFIKLTKNDKSRLKENLLFTIIIVINVFIFTLYLLSLLDIILNEIYLFIQLSLRVYYCLIAIVLSFLCCKLNHKIKMYENTNESNEKRSQKSLCSNTNTNCNANNKVELTFQNNEWMYFIMRKKQITLLYILNLIGSFLQLLFIILKHIFDDIFQKDQYRVISLKFHGYIIYYIYIFICFLNALVNYYCFYWIIRHQYSTNNDISKNKRSKKKKVIDENYIQRETIKNEEDEKEITQFMEEKKDKKKFMKSIYSNTFTEVPEDADKDKQENLFIQENDKDKDDKKVELINHSIEGMSEVGIIINNNNISQSIVNNESLL